LDFLKTGLGMTNPEIPDVVTERVRKNLKIIKINMFLVA
jgi:hypothetical protein